LSEKRERSAKEENAYEQGAKSPIEPRVKLERSSHRVRKPSSTNAIPSAPAHKGKPVRDRITSLWSDTTNQKGNLEDFDSG
jgi:hypothetical protein